MEEESQAERIAALEKEIMSLRSAVNQERLHAEKECQMRQHSFRDRERLSALNSSLSSENKKLLHQVEEQRADANRAIKRANEAILAAAQWQSHVRLLKKKLAKPKPPKKQKAVVYAPSHDFID